MRFLATTLRSLVRRPAFSLWVVLTLALGIGAPLAIFAVADALLLRSLPYPDADRLVQLWETVERDGTVERRAFSIPDYVDLRDRARSFEALAAYDPSFVTLRGGAGAERVQAVSAVPAYFQLLAGRAVRGGLYREDALEQGRATEAVISWRLWQSRFGGREDVVGELLSVNDLQREVVGVMERGFSGRVGDVDVWLPLDLVSEDAQRRDRRGLSVIGRLSEGQGIEAARSELQSVFAALGAEYPDSNRFYRADLGSLQDELFGDLRVGILALLAAVALVLAIALANVAHLLLVRTSARQRELSVRLALGASRRRIFAELMGEGLVLASAAGLLALLVGLWGVSALRLYSPVELPGFVELGLSSNVLALALVLVLFTAALLGVVAFRFTAADEVAACLHHQSAGSDPSRRRARALFLAFEVALTLVLLLGAGWLVLSLRQLQAVELGFEGREVVFANLELPTEEEPETSAARRRALEEVLESLPGVESVAFGSDMPLGGGYSATVVSPEGLELDPSLPYGGGVRVYFHVVTADYFETLGLPLLRGRGIEASDRMDGEGVVVVDRAMAERHWPGQEAVGRRIKLGRPPGPETDRDEIEWATVIGVVPEVRHRGLAPDPAGDPDDPDVYFALEQFADRMGGTFRVAARTEGPAELTVAALPASVQRHDPEIAVYGVETLAERIALDTARYRFNGSLMTLFALLSLLLAAIGIYGVVAFHVAQRTREIGVRMALGADRRRVVTEILREAAVPVLAGLLVGGVTARLLGRFLEAALFEVRLGDPRVFAVGVVALLVAAGLAATLPALRASRVAPVEALKEE